MFQSFEKKKRCNGNIAYGKPPSYMYDEIIKKSMNVAEQ